MSLFRASLNSVLLGAIMLTASGAGHAQVPSAEATPEMQVGIGTPVEIEIVVDGETKQLTFVENDDGDAIYQGDIILGKAVDLAAVSSGMVSLQSLGRIELFGLVVRGVETRWPLGRFRYRLDPALHDPARVRAAIAHWEESTDIEFEEIDDTSGAFVTFANGSGCSSALGRKGGEQYVRLAPGCRFGQVVHEIGHALGLHHEHARSDRDQFVRILEDNILEEREFNFRPDPIRFADSGPYCYRSIMHYGPFAFSKRSGSLPTIETVDQSEIGQRDALAQCDIDTISRLYVEELTKRPEHGLATQSDGSSIAGAAGLPLTIRWRDYTIAPDGMTTDIADVLTLDPALEAENEYFFLQFDGPITREKKDLVGDLGVELLEYVPSYAYIARLGSEARKRLDDHSFVRVIGAYQPWMRLAVDLHAEMDDPQLDPAPPAPSELVPVGEAADPVPGTSTIRVNALLFEGADLEAVRQAVQSAGGTDVEVISGGSERPRVGFVIAPSELPAIARIPGVMWLEKHVLPKLRNDTSRDLLNIAPIWTSSPARRGSGQLVAVADTGLDSGVNDASMHADFRGPRLQEIVSLPVSNGIGALNPGTDDGPSDLDGHGTHVAGSALGSGAASGEAFAGVAPEAALYFQAIEQLTSIPNEAPRLALSGIPSQLADLFAPAYAAGARIHTNSWGTDDSGAYSFQSEAVDRFVWDHPDLLVLFAAGNAGVDSDANGIVDPGSVGSPATCKNCLSVGASENARSAIELTYSEKYPPVLDADRRADAPNGHGLAAFSSRGPTDLARTKPDVVAPGTMVLSARTSAPANQILRGDDLETDSGQWTADAPWSRFDGISHSGTRSYHDSPGGDYAKNIDVSLAWAPIDLSAGGMSKSLVFWSRYDLGTGDHWFLRVSDPAVGDGELGPFVGSRASWERSSIDLGPWSQAQALEISFQLVSDNDGDVGDGLFVDDVQLVDGAFGFGLPSEFGMDAAGGNLDQNYMFLGGTSMATPLVAGASALLREHFQETLGFEAPSAALLRAALINGAVDINPGQYAGIVEIPPAPNDAQGWGRVDLAGTIHSGASSVLSHIDDRRGLETGQATRFFVDLDGPAVPLKATLVYHDFPGPSLVNDLDLSIIAPDTSVHHPNGGSATDAINNVEQVVLASPTAGRYTIVVTATNVPEEPQPFALVVRAGAAVRDHVHE